MLTHATNLSIFSFYHINLSFEPSYGGPVIQNVEVHTIFYGNPNYQTQLNAFYMAVVKSPWIAMMTEYNTTTPTVQKIDYGTFGGSYIETGTIKTTLDDVADIQPYLVNLAKSGIISPNANTFFAMHFGPGITITQGTTTSCVQFCAYHAGGCATGCGSGTTFQNLCSVSSHELGEAITDAGVGLATSYAYPLAWYDSVNGENGDICNAQQGSFVGSDGVTYTVQKLWSNALKACIASKPTTPTSTTTTSTTTSSSSSRSTTTTTSTCAHSICVTGVKLASGCEPCATKIIEVDSYCGRVKWNSNCVAEVKTVCGVTC
ncbi:hypothetical protein HDU76_004297 [Blyttiomyces sp. JEL0837]|nr:hypothetical protein HDU76_004297 [Blyttiomyces sp. JEL0837]